MLQRAPWRVGVTSRRRSCRVNAPAPATQPHGQLRLPVVASGKGLSSVKTTNSLIEESARPRLQRAVIPVRGAPLNPPHRSANKDELQTTPTTSHANSPGSSGGGSSSCWLLVLLKCYRLAPVLLRGGGRLLFDCGLVVLVVVWVGPVALAVSLYRLGLRSGGGVEGLSRDIRGSRVGGGSAGGVVLGE
jgi:hypothetical protein